MTYIKFIFSVKGEMCETISLKMMTIANLNRPEQMREKKQRQIHGRLKLLIAACD